MAARPRVGVTGNGRRWAPAWWCTAIALWLTGALPERISVRHPPSGRSLDALIIGGGNDIGPEHYAGDVEAEVRADPERDILEIDWIKTAIKENIPMLGICRGAQLINVVLGGNLHQDIRPLRIKTRNRPGLLPTKRVQIDDDSNLARICRRKLIRVNSLHHQAVDRVGDGLKAVGRDRDLIVQAIESESDRPIIGVQWHPEYLIYLPSQFALFRWLISHAGS